MAGGESSTISWEPRSLEELDNLYKTNPIRAKMYVSKMMMEVEKAMDGDTQARRWLLKRESIGVPWRDIVKKKQDERTKFKESLKKEEVEGIPFEKRETTRPRFVKPEGETTKPSFMDLEGSGLNPEIIKEYKNYPALKQIQNLIEKIKKPLPEDIKEFLLNYPYKEFPNWVLDVIEREINTPDKIPEYVFEWVKQIASKRGASKMMPIYLNLPYLTLGYKDFFAQGSAVDDDLDFFGDIDFATFIGNKVSNKEFVDRLIFILKDLPTNIIKFKEFKAGAPNKDGEQPTYGTIESVIKNREKIIKDLRKGRLIKTEFIIPIPQFLDNNELIDLTIEASNSFFFEPIEFTKSNEYKKQAVETFLDDIEKKFKGKKYYKTVKRIRSFLKQKGKDVKKYSEFLNKNSDLNYREKYNKIQGKKDKTEDLALQFLKSDKLSRMVLEGLGLL